MLEDGDKLVDIIENAYATDDKFDLNSVLKMDFSNAVYTSKFCKKYDFVYTKLDGTPNILNRFCI